MEGLQLEMVAWYWWFVLNYAPSLVALALFESFLLLKDLCPQQAEAGNRPSKL